MSGQEIMLADLGAFILAITISVLLVVVVAAVLTGRKSKQYRMFLTDMYVSAKIRLLADEDGLKIPEETVSFNEWNKKERSKERTYNLDSAVEADLIEKIGEPVKKAK